MYTCIHNLHTKSDVWYLQPTVAYLELINFSLDNLAIKPCHMKYVIKSCVSWFDELRQTTSPSCSPMLATVALLQRDHLNVKRLVISGSTTDAQQQWYQLHDERVRAGRYLHHHHQQQQQHVTWCDEADNRQRERTGKWCSSGIIPSSAPPPAASAAGHQRHILHAVWKHHATRAITAPCSSSHRRHAVTDWLTSIRLAWARAILTSLDWLVGRVWWCITGRPTSRSLPDADITWHPADWIVSGWFRA